MNNTASILIVDDEEVVRRSHLRSLADTGCHTEAAEDGHQALQVMEQHPFDVVLLDLSMPGLDGIDTLKEFRKINPDLQIIILTGQATVQKGIEAMKLGAVDLMEKPTDLKKLLAKIEEASSKKAVLVEKQIDAQLKDIMGKKGW